MAVNRAVGHILTGPCRRVSPTAPSGHGRGCPYSAPDRQASTTRPINAAPNVHMRFGVVIDPLEELIRPLTFAGLVVATSLYYLLIRRRRRQGDDAEASEREALRRRVMARFRRLQRRDDR